MGVAAIGPALRVLDWFAGERIRWFRFVGQCPCWDKAKGTYDHNHALCHGTGEIKEEVDVSRYKAIVTSVTVSKVFTGIGELDAGDLTCSTWPQEIPLAKRDEVVVPSRTTFDTALIKRGVGVDQILAASNGVVLTSLVVDRIYDLNGPITEGWALQTGGIAWETGHGPAKGAQYAVHYKYTPRWEVQDAGILTRRPDPGGKPIPQRVGLKLMPLVR